MDDFQPQNFGWQPHFEPILKLADSLRIPRDRPEVQNALFLARATRNDLLVILERPALNSHFYDANLMVQTSGSLQYLDKCLRKFSGGSRNIENTAVFDIFPLRSQQEQREDGKVGGEQLVQDCDMLSYLAFKDCVKILRPRVVLVCHCKPGDGSEFSRVFTSSMRNDTERYLSTRILGCETTVVRAFHPGSFLNYATEGEEVRLRRNFDTYFLWAMNAVFR